MRLCNKLSSQFGELLESIEMAIYRYLRSHETLGDELYNIGGEQVSVYITDNPKGGKMIVVRGKNPGEYEGTKPLRDIRINHQLDILERMEDILRVD